MMYMFCIKSLIFGVHIVIIVEVVKYARVRIYENMYFGNDNRYL